MLVCDSDPLLPADLAAFGCIEEMSHDCTVIKCFLVIVERLYFDKTDTAIFDGVVVSVPVRFLYKHLVFLKITNFHRYGLDRSVIHDIKAGSGSQRQRG